MSIHGLAQDLPIPPADTDHYLWVTYVTSPDQPETRQPWEKYSRILIEQSTPVPLSIHPDVWRYELDKQEETLTINNKPQTVDGQLRGWLEEIFILIRPGQKQKIYSDYFNSGLQWYWKLDADKGFISVFQADSTEKIISFYVDPLFDNLPEYSKDDLRVEVMFDRHFVSHQLVDDIVLLDASSELFADDRQGLIEEDIILGFYKAIENAKNSKVKLESWLELQPYLNR